MRRVGIIVVSAVLATLVLAAVGSAPASAAPCEMTWANPGVSGVWDQLGVIDSTEDQWGTNAGVPGVGDVVCLPAGNYTVTLGVGDSAAYTIDELQVGTSADSPQPTFRINTEEALNVTGGVIQEGGTVIVTGLLDPATYALNGGRLGGGVVGASVGSVNAPVTNNGGVLNPGDPSGDETRFLAINGSYTQGDEGVWHSDIDGPGSGAAYDHVHFTGVADIDGAVEVDMTEFTTPSSFAEIGISDDFTGLVEVFGVPESWKVILTFGPNEHLRIVPSPSFNDVPFSNQFFFDIEWLNALRITGGFPDGGYHPTAPVTRQSMAAFLYRLAGEPVFKLPEDPLFNDVPESHNFYTEISWLAVNDIAGGFADGGYHPTAPVTRQSMAAFLYRLAGEPAFTPPGTPSFDDVPLSHTFYDEIEWLVDVEVTGGFADGGYHPGASVTRQSMAAFLHRYDSNGIPILPD
jgi:hypothetical protein